MRMFAKRWLLVPAVAWIGSGAAWGQVLLRDDFNGSTLDTGKWNVIKQADTSVQLTGDGQLQVALPSSATAYAYQGLMSKQSFVVPAGQRLIVDYYGTNGSWWSPTADSQGSCPTWLVSPVDKSGAEFLYSNLSWLGGPSAAIVGAGSWTDDYAGGYDAGKLTYGAYKHCIIAIDRTNIQYYIADTAYDPSMPPAYTQATSSVFSSADLDSGVFVYLLADRTQNWEGITNYEGFDGVQVSLVNESSDDPILFQDDFNGSTLNASKWNVIKEADTSVQLTGSGELQISVPSTSTQYRFEGIISKGSFPIPSDQRLIVDYYGTNGNWWSSTSDSQGSCPAWLVSPVDKSGAEFLYNDLSWLGGPSAAIVGAGSWTDDYAGGYDVGKPTYGAYKHCIIAIDRTNINFYIADAAYDASMTPAYTQATSSVFSSADLDNGVFIYLLADRTQNWEGITNYERFDGVQVSRAGGALQGTISLEGYQGSYASIGVTFVLQPVGTRGPITRQCLLNADGSFSLANLPLATYQLTVSNKGWLPAVVNSVTVQGYPITVLAPIQLKGGDFNGDGQVSFEDFGLLQNEYGQSGGAAGIDPLSTAVAAGGCGPVGLLLIMVMALGFVTVRNCE